MGAAAVHVGNLTGPGFSSDYRAPSLLGENVRQVTGTGESQAFQFFTFTLPAGAQALSFDFWAPQGVGYSYSQGNLLRRDASLVPTVEEPVAATTQSEELVPPAGAPRVRNPLRPSGRSAAPPAPALSPLPLLSVPLEPGPFFTDGPVLPDPVAAAAEPAPSVVPLPGAGGMLLTAMGLAGLMALGRRRRV